jgi:CRISPR-associated protein Cmr2
MTFTAVTFAPVQSFIRSSRKLRDLYGSSLLLSHLARALHDDAIRQLNDQDAVISPAEVAISRGVSNTLIIRGNYSASQARKALLSTWDQVLQACRTWLERQIKVSAFQERPQGWKDDWEAGWGASWKAAALHSWEVFQGQGATIAEARQALDLRKQQRDWQIPNWTGESSTLSSTEAVLRPSMSAVIRPWELDATAAQREARSMLGQLRESKLGEAFAEANEEISLVEMVKRLITYEEILKEAFHVIQPGETQQLLPSIFSRLSTRGNSAASIIWFMGDGDRISNHLKTLSEQGDEESVLRAFSSSMRRWAASMYDKVPLCMGGQIHQAKATVVYAGGDDLLGALHETTPGARDLHTGDLWHWLVEFPKLWGDAQQPGQPLLTMSMGLVWAHANVPQREALQHARDAEATAKARGRDRFALRLLYPSGNHLEWSCPWTWLEPILFHYRDREGRCFPEATWRHLADDVVWLQERQAIGGPITPGSRKKDQKAEEGWHARANATSMALWKAYFPRLEMLPIPDSALAAISQEPTQFIPTLLQPEEGRPLHLWLRDLGLVMAGLEKREAA